MVKYYFELFSPIIDHMKEVSEIFIFCHVTLKLVEIFEEKIFRVWVTFKYFKKIMKLLHFVKHISV